jgi:hypothetical protein
MRTSTSNDPINLVSARVFQVCHSSFSPKVLPQCYFLTFSLSFHSLSLPPSLPPSPSVSASPSSSLMESHPHPHFLFIYLFTHTRNLCLGCLAHSFFLPHTPRSLCAVQFATAAVRINFLCMWEQKKEEKNLIQRIKMDFFYAHMQTILVLLGQTQACLIKHSCLVKLRGDTFGLCKIMHLCHFVRLKSGARHPTPCFHYHIPTIGTFPVQLSSMGLRDGWFRLE